MNTDYSKMSNKKLMMLLRTYQHVIYLVETKVYCGDFCEFRGVYHTSADIIDELVKRIREKRFGREEYWKIRDEIWKSAVHQKIWCEDVNKAYQRISGEFSYFY